MVRRHLLDGFDAIWIDSLNGDSRETGKLTPAGEPDPPSSRPSSTARASGSAPQSGSSCGATVGAETPPVRYRDFWGVGKREELVASLDDPDLDRQLYRGRASPGNRFNFRPQSGQC